MQHGWARTHTHPINSDAAKHCSAAHLALGLTKQTDTTYTPNSEHIVPDTVSISIAPACQLAKSKVHVDGTAIQAPKRLDRRQTVLSDNGLCMVSVNTRSLAARPTFAA